MCTFLSFAAQASSRVQRVLALEVDVGSSRAAMERLNNELAAISAEKSRLKVEVMTLESLKDSV